ncbi:hypothetical protein ACEWPM_004620 [Roseovarius sp. S4756]|uniref:hypothetical protein n=1 Tax=Roseovarius maritimus TaxID=3342637 RepID=UPI00372CE5C1
MSIDTVCKLHGHFARGSIPRTPPEGRRKRGWCSAENIGAPLLQCLKTALLAIAILIALCVRSDAQQSLSAVEIQDQIVGHSFQGRKGILSVSLHYAEDGTVTMRSPLGSGTGRWTLPGDQLCVKMETGPKKANECLAFTRQPDGTYRASNGLRLTPVK